MIIAADIVFGTAAVDVVASVAAVLIVCDGVVEMNQKSLLLQ